MNAKLRKGIQLILVVLFIALVTWLAQRYGIDRIRANIDALGIWAVLGVISLRFLSVVIPALPGTAYSVLAGGLFGFAQGLLVICLADLASCTLSFTLSRRYGRGLVQKLVGTRFMHRVDRLSQQHLESNFFLMTGFLMTGFFDFVCYGVGLTKVHWLKFLPALVTSILISNPPIVALGAGLLEGGKLLLGLALLGVFLLAIVTGWIQRRQESSQSDANDNTESQG